MRYDGLTKNRKDWVLIFIFGVIAFSFSSWLSRSFLPTAFNQNDIWFASDVSRVVGDMSLPAAPHSRTSVHPIFPFVTMPISMGLMAMGLSQHAAISAIISLSAALSVGLTYSIGRRLGASRLDASILCFVLMSSASFIYWWSIPDTFPIGSLTIFFTIWVCTLPAPPLWLWVFAASANLAITTTNWIIGILAGFFFNRIYRFLIIVAGSLTCVVALSILQYWLLPRTGLFFLPSAVGPEKSFIFWENSPGLIFDLADRAASLLIYTGTAPDYTLNTQSDGKIMLMSGYLRDIQAPSAVLTIIWIVLLVYGLIAIIRDTSSKKIGYVISLYIISQLSLHAIYGEDPFLYTAHFLPAAIALIAVGLAETRDTSARLLAIVYCLVAAVVNVTQFQAATEAFAKSTKALFGG